MPGEQWCRNSSAWDAFVRAPSVIPLVRDRKRARFSTALYILQKKEDPAVAAAAFGVFTLSFSAFFQFSIFIWCSNNRDNVNIHSNETFYFAKILGSRVQLLYGHRFEILNTKIELSQNRRNSRIATHLSTTLPATKFSFHSLVLQRSRKGNVEGFTNLVL